MSKMSALSADCPSCGAAAGDHCQDGYELYVLEGEVRRDLGVVASLKEAERKIVGSINYDDVEVFARQLTAGPIWAFRVNEGDSTPDWWRIP